jgi:2-polyprenyl-6-hydroxyphenyl methylase/3-demethylubiquinone-9 3-methyltransferase
MTSRKFDFGQNWLAFSSAELSHGRLEEAERSLLGLLGTDSLRGQTVMDVGCGSGLFAIAAVHAGARRVVGLDVNPLCIEVSRGNADRLIPARARSVEFAPGDALQPASLQRHGRFDLVYAWGSLHHSGHMWDAIRHVAAAVSEPNGRLVLALYNRHWSSPGWTAIKWLYNVLPRFLRTPFALALAAPIFLAKLLVTGRNPLKKERGMSFWFDIVDWVGGYPYEYASRDEVVRFVEPLGFALETFRPPAVATGCNEFVFRRTGTAAS